MRLIHTRKRVFDFDKIFTQKISLLTWVLSILKIKEFGHQAVLYTDTKTLEDVKQFGFEDLYDEINTTYLEDEEVCKGINFHWFWAMPKLLAYKHELEIGNNPLMIDEDLVLMVDIENKTQVLPLTVWNNKEFLIYKGTYPSLDNLSTHENYEFPKWFKGNIKPLNSGILYFKRPQIALEYLEEVFRFVINNNNNKNNTMTQTMCTAEQRFLGEYVKYKGFSPYTIQPTNEGFFNKNGFHLCGYKGYITRTGDLQWNLNILIAIKKINSAMFKKLINHELFEVEKQYFNEHGYTCEEIKELARYNL